MGKRGWKRVQKVQGGFLWGEKGGKKRSTTGSVRLGTTIGGGKRTEAVGEIEKGRTELGKLYLHDKKGKNKDLNRD